MEVSMGVLLQIFSFPRRQCWEWKHRVLYSRKIQSPWHAAALAPFPAQRASLHTTYLQWNKYHLPFIVPKLCYRWHGHHGSYQGCHQANLQQIWKYLHMGAHHYHVSFTDWEIEEKRFECNKRPRTTVLSQHKLPFSTTGDTIQG